MRSPQIATDKDLRFLTYKYDYVIAEFVSDECPVCHEMTPVFEKMANAPSYKDVLFLIIDADENPVSSNQVKLTGTPFVATYKKSTLRNCRLIKDEDELRFILDQLIGYNL
ncbi:thioredoxin family protein [Pontibacter sp. MBLB2868]|uniref:thioredoxin family protein n=1 Tax=Pontibacter sp. MBLB2868 TaxID=3451555 RepID=UPI003F74DF72